MTRVPGRPSFSTAQAAQLAETLFGVKGMARELPSDRDQNFRLLLDDGGSVVLKVFNTFEKTSFLACQETLLDTVVAQGLPAPKVLGKALCTPDGTLVKEATAGERLHHVRLISWLEGTPLGLVKPIGEELEKEVGSLLAQVDQSLVGFLHDGAPTDFVWDLAHAVQTISERVHHLETDQQQLVHKVLLQYQELVQPEWKSLPKAVIHNDANDYNILVRSQDEMESADLSGRATRITGLLDYGDVVYSARIANPAIAAAYLALHRKDPVVAICNVLAGYHALFPVSEAEVNVFFTLVCTRLAISVCMSAAARNMEPGNTYLSISEHDAWACLKKLDAIHPRLAAYRVRHALGWTPFPGQKELESWFTTHRDSFHPVLSKNKPTYVVMDFSVASLEFAPDALSIPGLADQLIWDKVGPHVGIGRWNEPRLVYTGDQYATVSGERRTIHIGVDLFRPALSPVYAPLDAVVYSCCAHHEEFDYGGCVLLEHRPPDGPVFWTLYGHLSHNSAMALQPGQFIAAGEAFAELGAFEENGGWVPHLHFQIVSDLLGLRDTYPGVAAPDVRDVWLSLSPSPAMLLGLPPESDTPTRPRVESLQQRRKRHIGGSLSVSYARPLHIVRGWGTYLYDAEGRAFLDAVNNVPHVGHSNPRVVDALRAQMQTLTTNTRYLHENILAYAERLTATLPDSLEVCYFVNSGSEANDLAIRLARTFTGRSDMIVLDGAYHGNLTTLIGLSPYKFDGPGGRGKPDTTHVVRMPDPYRGPFKGMSEETGLKYAEEVQQVVASHAVAGFIAESVPGVGGQIVLPPRYLSSVANLVREAGGVFIADEVQIGMGRTGTHFWGFELDHVVPDIVVLGKPIGNGHPLGAVITTRAIADAFDNGMEYFNTFGGNPASCAVGLAVLDEIESKGLQQNALAVGSQLLEGLASLALHHKIIGDVRGVGLFIGVELVRSHVTLEPADIEATYVANRMRDNGILISTDGPLHNVLKIKPPMTFSAENAAHLISTLDSILAEDAVRARIAQP